MNTTYIKISLFFLSYFLVGYFAYSLADNKAKVKMAEFQKQIAEQNTQVIQENDTHNQNISKVTIDTTTRAIIDERTINELYQKYKFDDAFDFGITNTDSVYYTSTDNNKSVSKTADTTSDIQKGRCKCTEFNKTKFQRLYERQLMIAKDCDITASYYNNLIDLYNQVQQQQ